MAKLRITYTKSAIGYSKDQKETVRSLGLHKLNSTVIQNDTPAIRGMIFKVRHLVKAEEVNTDTPTTVAQPVGQTVAATLSTAEPEAPATADDLTVVEGIGPKIASILQAAGITTYAQLASSDAAHLAEILDAANLRLASAESWPEQAQLAAAGDWDALKQLQNRLKGGRHE